MSKSEDTGHENLKIKANEYQVVYNSDLIIRDPGEAATLCVFYDRIFLPFTDGQSAGGLIDATTKTTPTTLQGESQRGCNTSSEETVFNLSYIPTDDIKKWEITYGTLFDEGVLVRVKPPVEDGAVTESQTMRIWDVKSEDLVNTRCAAKYSYSPEGYWRAGEIPWGTPIKDGDLIDSKGKLLETQVKPEDVFLSRGMGKCFLKQGFYIHEFQVAYKEVRRLIASREQWGKTKTITLDITPSSLPYLRLEKVGNGNFVRADLLKHLLRSDIDLPQIYSNSKGQRLTRQALVALEAQATFSYLLPKVRVYHPTQVLELRERIRDTREGFAMHLLKLSKGLEAQAKDGAPLDEVARYATNLIETELIPDYREFKRQLESIKAGSWKNFLDAAGTIAEIDAAPWTPKFWALLLKALGMTFIETASDQTKRLTNSYQAYKFMGEIERAGR